MKKSLTFALLAALSFGGLTISESKADTLAVAAIPAVSNDHVSLAKALLAGLDEMIAVLDTVKDKASADAAAAKLTTIAEDLKATVAAGESLGDPDAATQAQLEALKPELEARIGGLMEKLMPIAMNNFYGSTALKTALEGMN